MAITASMVKELREMTGLEVSMVNIRIASVNMEKVK